ncbi:MAG: ABC transporter ATP-binding protein [Pseudomonadota bacterium]
MSDPILQTRSLSKSFGALRATQEVSIDLKSGEIHAIIGPNGAGKSTLIQQITGILPPDSGSVHFMGRDVTTWSTPQRAEAGLGRTFQISALATEDSALENVLLGAIGAMGRAWHMWRPAPKMSALRDRAEEALARVGLSDHAHTRCAELSHGMRRQLEVAIALTLQPKAFLMDEPMAGLGSEGSKALTELLSRLRDEAPILLIEHDMDAVFALADRISVLVNGQIIATGTVAEIRASRDVQQAYLGETA